MRARDKGKKARQATQPTIRTRRDSVLAAEFRGEILTPAQIFQRYGRALGFSYQSIYLRVKRGRIGEEIIGRKAMRLVDYSTVGPRIRASHERAQVITESAKYVATYEDLQRAFLEKAGVVAPALTPSQPPDLDDGSES